MSQQATSADITHDHELDVLSQIHHNRTVKQRDIARTIYYLVTPDGIDLIARRS